MPPVAVDDSVEMDENPAETGIDVLHNDTDADSDPLTIVGVTTPANGAVHNYGTYVSYTPVADFVGTDTFTYTITDGTKTATATVTVTVKSTNNGGETSKNGKCGDADDQFLTAAPTLASDLCSVGIASAVSGEGPWSWNCAGVNGGEPASCSTSTEQGEGTDGKCGNANGKSFTSEPTDNLCSAGEASEISGDGPWTWSCAGVDGGQNATNCKASVKSSHDSGSQPHLSHPGDFVHNGSGGVKPQVAGASIDLDEIQRLINAIKSQIAQLAADLAARNGSVLGAATEVTTGVLD